MKVFKPAGATDLLSKISALFKAKGMVNAKRQAEDLLCDVLQCSRAELFQTSSRRISEEKMRLSQEWAERRLKGEPLAYISGKVNFYGCTLAISPAVLIPRPETELLVDKIVAFLKTEDRQGKILWDLCCGSGCIGIALKKALPDLTVCLSDRSSEAVALAARNARANHADIACFCGDLMAPFHGKKAHFIVSNPPYVSKEEYDTLDAEVKDFEPQMALLAGESGLEFYELLAQELPLYLFPKGKVWLEIGYRQGEAVKALFQCPPWKNQQVEKDYAGHDRFFFLENE